MAAELLRLINWCIPTSLFLRGFMCFVLPVPGIRACYILIEYSAGFKSESLWVERASTLSSRELEREVVKVNPKALVQESITPIAENLSKIAHVLWVGSIR